MMVRDAPFVAALDDNHAEARWIGDELAIAHYGEFVEAGTEHGRIAEDHHLPFADRNLVSGPRKVDEISAYGFAALRDDRAGRTEQDCVRRIGIDHRLDIVGAV